MPSILPNRRPAAWLALLLAFAATLWSSVASAANTDIASAPLFTSSNTLVKPNIMFVLDDSGSMAWDYLPDVSNFGSTKYGKKTYQCNGVAYNPGITYSPPKNADGTTQANASLSVITSLSDPTTQTTSQRSITGTVTMPTTLTGTMSFVVTGSSMTASTYQAEQSVTIFQNSDTNRFFTGQVDSWTLTNSSSGTLVVDISAGFMEGTGTFNPARVGNGVPQSPTYYTYSGSQAPLSYTYTSSGVITSTTFYRECNSVVGSTPGSGVFTAVSVTASSAEAQNYANWATFYSTRMKMMKSSVSRAFVTLDNRYRVGYSTINERTAVAGTNFMDIGDFDATQKTSFYSKLNAATPGSNTPLRGALSKAGQYYAKLARGQTVDPVQYSCQRNYTILSTDGYWNTGSENNSTSPKYGPYRLDNSTAVGQQDGTGTARPMLDGEQTNTTILETWTVTAVVTRNDRASTTVATIPAGTATATLNNASGTSEYRVTTGRVGSVSGANNSGGVTITRSGSVITVTGITHMFVTGDRITITGTSGANSNFLGTNVTVTRLSATSFSYPAAASSGSAGSATYTFTPQVATALSCTAGNGPSRQLIEGRNITYTLTRSNTPVSSVTTTTTTPTTETTITPYTRTIQQLDGVTTSDTTAAGTAQVSTVNGTATTVVSSPVSSSQTVTYATGSAGSTLELLDDLTSTGATCVNTAINVGSTQSLGGSNPSVSGTVSVAATTSTTVGNPSPIVLSSTSSESAHVTADPVVTGTTGGASDTLADVAMYYYKTDLRDSSLSNCTGALNTDVCTNNVPGSTASAQRSFGDAAAWQHMTTFTLGLGVGGLLTFDPNYLTQTSGDFVDIINRSKNWPQAGPSKGPENIDDLWHAAVNGRGQYFSAGDPSSLADALTAALDSIKAITGAAAAASTSSLQPVEGDNDVFVAQFTSVKWTGDVLSYRIDPNAGTISNTPVWSAKTQLDAKTPGSRVIYYPNPTYSQTLRAFNTTNLTTDNYITHFNNFCSKTGAGGASAPSQCASLTSTETTLANTATNLVSYLRGDQTMSYYRTRDSRLGDIISASPLFVGKPAFKYTENNYGTYVSTKANRTAVVLTAANDGMLHAFRRDTGDELWAFMPSTVIPNLYKLADDAYTNNHQYYVDGSPQMGDIWDGTNWKTIVVGGLNAGGKSYYALDVTDPAAPKFLWEFSHQHLGLTFGNPIITKRADGTWIVAFTSGYNNTASGGDGNGHLFIVNANTGALITQLPTNYPDNSPAGDSNTPSGLAKLNVWVNAVENNTAQRFYAGDLLGNLWRFDVDSLVAPNNAALLLATLTSPDGTRQSITTRPSLAEVLYNGIAYPVVYVATGKYLGTSDASSTAVQSIYAIKDTMTSTGWGTAGLRTTGNAVAQTLSVSTTANGRAGRTVSAQAVDWGTKAGWYADFPVGGERVTVNPQISLSTITVGSILPSSSACTVGGESFLYRFDINNGGSVSGTSTVGTYVGNVLIQGLTNVQLGGTGSGAGSIVTITTRSDATLQTDVTAVPTSAANLRRTSWRELVD